MIWCTLIVMMECMNSGSICAVSTAVKGEIIKKQGNNYLVDFSEYAKQKGYLELDKPKVVSEERCVEE